MLEKLRTALLLRNLLKSQERMEQSVAEIAQSLRRIADHLAPPILEPAAEDLRQTSVTYSRDSEQARILDFEEAIFRRLGRPPTEQEILDHLEGREAGLAG